LTESEDDVRIKSRKNGKIEENRQEALTST